VARDHEEGGAGDHLAYRALVEQPARALMGAAQEGVGRAADPQAALSGRREQRVRLGEIDRERLLEIDVLAGGERGVSDRSMRPGDREVEHDLDGIAREQRLDGHRCDAELPPARLGRGLVKIGQRAHLELREESRRLQVGAADHAAADDADARRCSAHARSPRPGRGPIAQPARHGKPAARGQAIARAASWCIMACGRRPSGGFLRNAGEKQSMRVILAPLGGDEHDHTALAAAYGLGRPMISAASPVTCCTISGCPC
jgi:hypothetical protein